MDGFDTTEACALALDAADPLAPFRERFRVPDGVVYLDGNSLGLLSRDAEESLGRVLDEWRRLGVRGWLEAEPPWFYAAERLGGLAAELVGAAPHEVVLTGTTTTNIHALVSALYRPEGPRRKILADALNFPSDLYALEGQVRLRGGDPARDLVLVPSRDGRSIDEGDVIARMTDEVALVFLPSVLYRSGQLLDLEALTRAAHERRIPIGFDCSHSVGATRHELDLWGVDFAVWCGYKYLCGGPGCSAFLYLNDRHAASRPGLPGWFGYRKGLQFEMRTEFDPEPGARGWQISSPAVLGAAPLEGALGVIREAGLDRIEAKSRALTSYLVYLADELLSAPPYELRVGSPRDPRRRSGHVALERSRDAHRIASALKARGVVPDYRPPDTIRLAPVALYNRFADVFRAVQALKDVVDRAEHERQRDETPLIP